MASIHKGRNGTYRVRWRDPAGRQRSKSFKLRKEAATFVSELEVSLRRGVYVDPRAGKVKFSAYAEKYLASRNDEITTAARDASIMRNHVLPRWGATPLEAVDHTAVQVWVTQLGKDLSPATVAECFRLTSMVFKAACRDRVLGFNPCDGVRLPRRRKTAGADRVISREVFLGGLLPVVPERYRALVALAGGTGLRWGETVGLRWDAVDLENGRLHVIRTAVEVGGHVTTKPYPKSKAGRRVVPLPDFALTLLREQEARFGSDEVGHVFVNEVGGRLWRGHFRARVWRPSLVRAGLLGEVSRVEGGYLACWVDGDGAPQQHTFASEPAAVAHVVRHAAGGLRFHDLRHSYATWLVSQGVPINDVANVMGHEQTSMTLDRYTHSTDERFTRIREAFE